MKTLAPNTLLQNRYLIVQLIGKGGMGEVYLAVDQRLGSAIAIKRTTIAADDVFNSAAFETEAKTLARLRHPALTKVSDHFTENGKQFLVMEHISGDDLHKRLEMNQKPFPLDWVLYWGSQLLDALTYLHTQEPPIIHRDIKPQNLKLTDENNIILLDFGLAQNQPLDKNSASSSESASGYTPHYASLEQIRGMGTTPRSDVYSFAATVYQLLTNTVPPDALKRADHILNHLPDPVQPINELNPDVSSLISDVVLKGMNLAAEQRYQSAAEMQQALKGAFDEMQQIMSAQTIAFSYNPQGAGISEAQPMPAADLPQMPFSEDFAKKQTAENFGAATPPEFIADDRTAKLDESQSSHLDNGNQAIGVANGNGYPAEEIANIPTPYAADTNLPPAEIPSEIPMQATMITPPIAEENYSQPVVEENYQQNFVPVVENRVEPIPQPIPQTTPPPVPQKELVKESGGKSYGIIGAVLGFGILLLAAGGIGWFVLSNSNAAAVTPTPTATPEVQPTAPVVSATVEPTVAPTAQPTVEPELSDTNTASDSNPGTTANSSNSSTTENNSSNEKPVVTETRPSGTTPAQPRVTQPPRVAVSTVPPPAKTQSVKSNTPPAKKTEKPKAGSKDLLQ